MFFYNSRHIGLWRGFFMLFVTVGFFLSSGMNGNAVADQSNKVLSKKTNIHVAQRKRSKTTNRVAKSIFGKKIQRALSRPVKQSLRRLPARKSHTRTVYSRRNHSLHPRLIRLLATVKRHYGRVPIVSSGCRSHRHNRRVGGARRSMHLRCMAADFKVAGVSKAELRRYVSTLPGRGGVGTYCGRSIVHLDVGPRRSWYHSCRKRRKHRKRGS